MHRTTKWLTTDSVLCAILDGLRFEGQETKQEATIRWGLGKTQRCLIQKRCRYSSLEKSEDAFDTAFYKMQKSKRIISRVASPSEYNTNYCPLVSAWRRTRQVPKTKSSQAAFSAFFRTLRTADRKELMTSYPIWL